jgi:hypothetical protein
MPEPEKIFPEFGVSMDPKAVPWADAVVWAERMSDGRRVYEWIPKEHMRYASWDKGAVSVAVSNDSFLAQQHVQFLIRASFISIGKNVPVG